MAVKLESGQHRIVLRGEPSTARPRLWQDSQTDKIAQDLFKYQQRKRCNPREDFLFSSLGGMGTGLLGGFVIGAVPGLPLAGVGALVTGAVGAVVCGSLGALVGVLGGSAFAACHVHCHTPDPANLSRHVFSRFNVVSTRHQSRRISRQLVRHKVLWADDVRRVVDLDNRRLDQALSEVRLFGRPLGRKQRMQIKNILHIQALNMETADGRSA